MPLRPPAGRCRSRRRAPPREFHNAVGIAKGGPRGGSRAALDRVQCPLAGAGVGTGIYLEREPVWSISKANARLFFNLTFVTWTGSLTLLSLDEWAKAAAPVTTLPEAGYFAEIVLTRFTKFGLGLTMLCILLTIALAVVWRLLMALSDVINRKWVEPQKEKYLASRREAWRKRAQEEGHTAWRAWLNRRDAAHAKGEPFDEPAPDEQP